ncbi:hypothetical protein [Kineococcus sp. SYSU DK002]|uniref:hypothetical protein n=1 Tax=Kineococcus sp. SYSU DK002 TaxID=3383123 RepID=UPI003D7EEF12
MPLTARCTATLAGDEHSRIPLDDGLDDGMDAAEALERLSDATMPVRLLWSHDELDEALARHGWTRVGAWRYGPTADVQRTL